MTQQTLFPTDTARYDAWADFHRSNPHVFELFLRFALEAKRADKRIGQRCIWERMRWQLSFETTDEEFKLQDHHTAYYARLAMLVAPELTGFFETRDKRFDATDAMILKAHHSAKSFSDNCICNNNIALQPEAEYSLMYNRSQ